MIRPSEDLLHAWLEGALEPGEAALLEEQIASSVALRRRVEALRAQRDEDEAPEDLWLLPPLGHGHRGLGARVEAALHLDGAPRLGDPVRVHLRPPDALPRLVVVLMRASEGWQVVLPLEVGERFALSELPLGPEETRTLIVTPAVAGSHRMAVVLPPLGIVLDWNLPEAERWAGLRRALARGELPVHTFVVEVR